MFKSRFIFYLYCRSRTRTISYNLTDSIQRKMRLVQILIGHLEHKHHIRPDIKHTFISGIAEIFRKLYDLAHTDPEYMHHAPHHAQIGRPDEVAAARNPIVRWKKV